ncbi:hypothetical protein [Streptomyces sp. NPDC096193]
MTPREDLSETERHVMDSIDRTSADSVRVDEKIELQFADSPTT